MIEVQGLTKRYGDREAGSNLSFTVPRGRVTGFVGPNGAGKSTTMRMILGLAAPDGGEALVDGHPYGELHSPLREVGALLEATALHPGRRAYDHLLRLALSNHLPRSPASQMLDTPRPAGRPRCSTSPASRRSPAAAPADSRSGCASGLASPPRCSAIRRC